MNGWAWRGRAGHGQAWLGLARQGKARQGFYIPAVMPARKLLDTNPRTGEDLRMVRSPKGHGMDADLDIESRNKRKWHRAVEVMEEHFRAMTAAGFYGETVITITAQNGAINDIDHNRRQRER